MGDGLLLLYSFTIIYLHVRDGTFEEIDGYSRLGSRFFACKHDRLRKVREFQGNIQSQGEDLGSFQKKNEDNMEGEMELSP